MDDGLPIFFVSIMCIVLVNIFNNNNKKDSDENSFHHVTKKSKLNDSSC